MVGVTNKRNERLKLGSNWADSSYGNGVYPWIVTASISLFFVIVSIIPIYNKFFFKKSLYPYPIASAGIQLGSVTVLLVLINVVDHYCKILGCNAKDKLSINRPLTNCTENQETEQHQQPAINHSWIFGPHFLWKLKWCAPIGTLFGLKYGVTNLGLHLVPAPTHLLLQSTDLVWTLLGAWLINGERVTKIGFVCILGCIGGSVALSIRINETIEAPIFAIIINLSSPILLGLCLATLRLACTELMRKDNCVGGTVNAFELSAVKLIISSIVAICLACAFEGESTNPSWWVAFANLPNGVKVGVIGGSVLILIFQVNCTFLTFLTSAIDVGLVGQVKIIPQWISAALFYHSSSFQFSPLSCLGVFLTITSAGIFGICDCLSYMYPGKFNYPSSTMAPAEIHAIASCENMRLMSTDCVDQTHVKINASANYCSIN